MCLLFGSRHDLFVTDMIKIYTSMPRPNFYDMCGFSKGTQSCETTNAYNLTESQRAFPSGHASLAFSSMTILTLYFVGKVGIHHHDNNLSIQSKFWYLVSFLPVMLAIFIAASRIHDHYHHPADVIAGAMIGIASAIISHGMWYAILVSISHVFGTFAYQH